jgi:hypothetical protein
VAAVAATWLPGLAHAQAVPATQEAAAGAFKVTARAGATDVSVGQQFTVDVEATGPTGTTFAFPESAGNDKVELRLAPLPPGAGPVPNRRTYVASAFVVEDAVVPAVTVGYRQPGGATGSASSQPIPLRIVSLLPKGAEGRNPADIRPPVSIPIGAPFLAACGVAVALAAALVVVLVRRRRRPRAAIVPAATPFPPDVEANSALDALAARRLLDEERFKEFYVTLAETAKRYLERRLGAAVLEMTSAETIAFLRDHEHGRDLTPAVRDLVHTADFVKFARGAAAVDTARRHLTAVRAMVEGLETRLRAVEAAAPAVKAGKEAA